MSYDRVNPTYYRTFQPDTPFHAGAPGWTAAPWVTWGENPNLAGRRRLATDGLGKVVAISGLGTIVQSSDPNFTCPTDAPHRVVDARTGVSCYGDAEWAVLNQRAKSPAPFVPPPPSAYQTTISLPPMEPIPMWRQALGLVGAAACAYHGYKRNESVGWAFGWAIFGSALPILALPVALAQGFGKPKHRPAPAMATNPRRRRGRR